MNGVQRSYYPDGTLASEVPMTSGLPHGLVRHWHANGVLAEEIPTVQGRMSGLVKQWDETGRLLGVSYIESGTGMFRRWHQNGRLQMVGYLARGEPVGQHRIFDENGFAVTDIYWLHGKKVSKQRYLAACRVDPSLPRELNEAEPMPPSSEPTSVAPMTAEDYDKLAASLLSSTKAHDARSWLFGNPLVDRSLGEDVDSRMARKLIDSLEKNGARGVYVVDVQEGIGEPQNAGRLVVELPNDVASRERILHLVARIARRVGYGRDPDVGQRYVIVMLD